MKNAVQFLIDLYVCHRCKCIFFYQHVTFKSSLRCRAAAAITSGNKGAWRNCVCLLPSPLHRMCVWVVMAALHTGPPNSALHNIARCAFVEGMWLLMRRCRVVVVVSLLTETQGGAWTPAGRSCTSNNCDGWYCHGQSGRLCYDWQIKMTFKVKRIIAVSRARPLTVGLYGVLINLQKSY